MNRTEIEYRTVRQQTAKNIRKPLNKDMQTVGLGDILQRLGHFAFLVAKFRFYLIQSICTTDSPKNDL